MPDADKTLPTIMLLIQLARPIFLYPFKIKVISIGFETAVTLPIIEFYKWNEPKIKILVCHFIIINVSFGRSKTLLYDTIRIAS